MKILEWFRNLLFTTAVIGISVTCLSQKPVKNFDDSLSKTAYVVNNGDSIAVRTDSTIIMNKTTFHIYKKYYEKGLNANSSYKGVISVYEDIVRKQDSMLVEKEAYYKQLNGKYETLSGTSIQFMDRTKSSIDEVRSSLDSATVKMDATQKLLEASQKLLSEERKNVNLRVVKFGIGGLVIGALVTALVLGN